MNTHLGLVIQPTPQAELRDLYEADETAWLEKSAELIEHGSYTKLDFEHLREYLLDMAKRDRREVYSRLVQLQMHLQKTAQQPGKKPNKSWQASIVFQRIELRKLLLDSKTLRNHAEEVLAEAYLDAVKVAAKETGLARSKFPIDCPYTIDQLLTDD